MICPNCKANIAINVRQCPFCGSELSSKGHTSLGKASLILAILTFVCIIGVVVQVFSGSINSFFMFFVFIFSILSFILPIIAIILGAITYFGKSKDTYGLIGFILGICLLVSAPIANIASVHVYASNRESYFGYILSPTVIFAQKDKTQENTLTVIDIEHSTALYWLDIELIVDGMAQKHGMLGRVTVGDVIDVTSIAGTGAYTIDIRYKPTNRMIDSYYFTAGS